GFVIDVRRLQLLVRAADVAVRLLAHVAELLAKDGVLDGCVGEVVKPRCRGEFEVVVRVEIPKDFEVWSFDCVGGDHACPVERCIAAAVSAFWGVHARGNRRPPKIWEMLRASSETLARSGQHAAITQMRELLVTIACSASATVLQFLEPQLLSAHR